MAVVIIADPPEGTQVLCADETWEDAALVREGGINIPYRFPSPTAARAWLKAKPLGWFLTVPGRVRLLSERSL